MPFRGIIRGKACNRVLFCVKTGFPMVKTAESFDFPRIILRKGMPFCSIICGMSKPSADHTAERHAFPRKSKLSANYPAKVSVYHGMSKSHFLKAYHYFHTVLRIRDVYPGSRIWVFSHPGSRIPDLGSRIPKNMGR